MSNMFSSNKPNNISIVILVLFASLVTLFFSTFVTETRTDIMDDQFLRDVNERENRANGTVVMIDEVPDKVEGDFILTLKVIGPVDDNLSYIMFHSRDGKDWPPLSNNTYRTIDENGILIHGFLLEEGPLYFGVSLTNYTSPDVRMSDPIEVISSKAADASEEKEGFEPDTLMYVIVGAAIIVIGGFALIYKGRTDQIRSITRQLVEDEKKVKDKKKAEAEYEQQRDHGSRRSRTHRREPAFEDVGWDDPWKDGGEPEEISWGDAGGDHEYARDDGDDEGISWGDSGKVKGGRRKERRGRYDEDDHGVGRTSHGGYRSHKTRSPRGRDHPGDSGISQDRRRPARSSRDKGERDPGGRSWKRGSRAERRGKKDRGRHEGRTAHSDARRGKHGGSREERGERHISGRRGGGHAKRSRGDGSRKESRPRRSGRRSSRSKYSMGHSDWGDDHSSSKRYEPDDGSYWLD